MSTAGGAAVGRARFSLPGDETSHLPIRVAPQLMGKVRSKQGLETRVVLRMGRKTFSQWVRVKVV